MAIISRISRLFVSDMHAVLERLEEPELVLKQSIRDMEEALQTQQLRLQRQSAQLRRLQHRRQELDARLQSLNEQLDASIAAGRMDTARSTVRRKLECQAQCELLARQLVEREEQLIALGEGIERRASELEGLREKAHLLCETEERGVGDSVPADASARVNDQDVEAALIRELELRRAS